MSQNSTTFNPQNSSQNFSFSQIGTSLAGIMFIYATLQQFFPSFAREYLSRLLDRVIKFCRPEIRITFYEYCYSGYSYRSSEAYHAIEAYIGTLSMDVTKNVTRLKAEKLDKKSPVVDSLVFVLEDDEEITDKFQGVKFVWYLGKIRPSTQTISYGGWVSEKRYFTLSFNRKHRVLATSKYLTHVIESGETILKNRRTRMLYTNNPIKDWDDRGMWRRCEFEHSACFENLAMDAAKKNDIVQDLLTFTKAKDYYTKIGKAWKRGYLLYGPPGTGKTTMIACMANLLGYDVYDLELTTVQNNSELRNLLISTTGKCLILIEDIDCTLPIIAKRSDCDDGDRKKTETESDSDSEKAGELKAKMKVTSEKAGESGTKVKTKVTLSGLLNIIDGLWSPCSEERIIVFTTNHIEKLDPALIRTGRMDRHIEMSYCTFEAFKVFARNYLDIEDHHLFTRIEELLGDVEIGPSDVAEQLLPKSVGEAPEKRLKALIELMEERRKDAVVKLGKSEEIQPAENKEKG